MAAAKESFIKALEADPAAKLMSDFTTEELDKAFAEAKKEAKPGGEKPAGEKPAGEKPAGEKPAGETPAGEPATAGGDLEYEPPEEAQVNTPLPIFIKVPDDIGADKVKLRYKPFGGTEWQSIDMKAQGGGYAGVIPCADLTTTGKVRLYIIVMDPDGVPIATAGSLKEPHVVSIKTEIEGEQPALPGEEPPAKCILKEDCPPNFPGCGKPKGTQRGDKGWGASCEQTQECKAGYICLNGSCEEGEDDGAGEDDTSGGAGGGTHMISIGGQFDLMVLQGTEDVCSLAIDAGEGESVNYYCYYADDTGGTFAGTPLNAKNTNSLQGGMAFAGVRFLAGYDYVFPFGLGLGARLGYAVGGSPDPGDKEIDGRVNPQPFMPFHGEVRGSYFFRMDAEDGFRPFVFLNGGIANMAAGVDVSVCDQDTSDEDHEAGKSCNDRDGTPGATRAVEAHQVAGQGFIGVGGGLQYAIIENFGVQLDVKMMFMVPTFAFALAPVISPVVMFERRRPAARCTRGRCGCSAGERASTRAGRTAKAPSTPRISTGASGRPTPLGSWRPWCRGGSSPRTTGRLEPRPVTPP
jgi:hypothetical protein